MEQRNEMLKKMRLTNRQKKGDVQHMLSRSFSRKAIPTTPLSPPGEIFIPVPQFSPAESSSPIKQQSSPSKSQDDAISVGELSIEPRVAGSGSALVDMASLSPTQEQPLPTVSVSAPQPLMDLDTPSPPPATLIVGGGDKSSSITMEFGTGNNIDTQGPPIGTPPITRRPRKDSSSSSGSSCPEDQAVLSPLLEEPVTSSSAPTTLPVNSQPSIKRYDDMFKAADQMDLGATAASISTAQP